MAGNALEMLLKDPVHLEEKICSFIDTISENLIAKLEKICKDRFLYNNRIPQCLLVNANNTIQTLCDM